MQADPAPQSPPPAPGPVDVHIDFSGLANLIGQWFIDHLPDFGGVIWQGIKDHIGDIGTTIWTPLANTLLGALHSAVQAVWNATFGARANILGQLPPEWTYDSPTYRAIATDPLPIAAGGAMLALVLLGLRTLFGSMVGRDHVVTHVTGRLIPAVFLACQPPRRTCSPRLSVSLVVNRPGVVGSSFRSTEPVHARGECAHAGRCSCSDAFSSSLTACAARCLVT